jgi:hypothetical protein
MSKHWIAVCICVALAPAIGRADWQEVQSFAVGEPILVRTGFVVDAGKFVSATPDSVVVQTQTGPVTVAKSDVDEVLVFRSAHDRVTSGLIWGGVAAGATAAVFFPLTATMTHPNYGLAALVTASNGAVLGLGHGIFVRTKRIYRRKQ